MLWDKATLPKFVGASQDESQTSPVIGWILQKGDTEVEVMQNVYCRVNTFERKKGDIGAILSVSHIVIQPCRPSKTSASPVGSSEQSTL